MSSQLYCDLSGFKFLTFSQKTNYYQAYRFFDEVQDYNSNVSTLRAGGQSNLTYYQFLFNTDKTKFIQGRLLHIQSYPNSNWDLVQEN
jgi:hypothetical protein